VQVKGGDYVYKVMAFLATRRGIVLVALSIGTALINAKGGGKPVGFTDLGW
jgi:hypothetical protein